MSDDEDYEAMRQRNIAAREAFMKATLGEALSQLKEVMPKLEEKENCAPSPRSRRGRRSGARSPTFSVSRVSIIKKKYNTRSRKRSKADSDEEEEDDEHDFNGDDIVVPKRRSIKVMFPWSRPIQRDIDLMRPDYGENESDSGAESELEYHEPKRKRVQRMSKSTYDPATIPSPDEITQRMLDNIAAKASGKVYDAYNGTSCHQCRQKTKDTKTVCRSGECIGVRGQFCGPCLKGRYGESAYDALKDPFWACPPCRGLCNCSICRTRNGQRPTGILAPLAKEEGFSSVKDYLQAKDYDD